MSKGLKCHLDIRADRISPLLKVWWIPQIPGKPFEVILNSFAEARVLLESLAQYDLFQLRNRIKPDYSNTGGLQIYEDDEWTDWSSDEGESIDDLSLDACVNLDREFYNSVLQQAATS